MKNFLLLFLLMAFYSNSLSAQTIYVNAAASGNNDGSSWENAYTNLQTALDNAGEADLWIAAGTYSTATVGSDATAVFSVTSSANLYGGFAGTESSLEDRNIASNPTILSGDINGDDIAGNFETNREDNSFHVMNVDSDGSSPVTIDGLTFMGGQTSDDGDAPFQNRAGGGIFGLTPVMVHQCFFTNNFGRAGSGIYLIDRASGSMISECTFNENLATTQSAGVMFDNLSNIQVLNCVFNGNDTNRGVIYSLACDNVSIDGCTITDNVNEAGFSAGLYSWQSTNFKLINSTITDNSAANAGAFYVDARDILTMNPQNFMIENCVFSNNTATDFGGGTMYVFRASMTIDDCTFQDGSIPGSGGFIFFAGDDKVVDIKNTSFSGMTINGWGGAHTCYGGNSTFNISNCMYENNSCENLGGAINAGFYAVVNIDGSRFEGNAGGNGGAVCAQNDSTEVHVTNSEFISNSAENGNGGALFGNGSNIWSVNGSRFEGNMADFGAAITINEAGDDDIGVLELHNSTFIFNLAQVQGGAVNIIDANTNITNCVFANNLAIDPGTGGAISTNAGNNNDVTVSIVNSTFYENSGELAAGIAQWTESADSASLELTLQNNIFQNAGNNYAIEDGAPTVVSNGGNLDENDSMGDVLTHSMDINNVDAMLVDPDDFDYHLAEGSPAIGAGVAEGAPILDIEGFVRGESADIGAYEFDQMTGTAELIPNDGVLTISPNPVRKSFLMTLENEWTTDLTISIVDVMGRIVYSAELSKYNDVFSQEIAVEKLAAGNYYLMVSNGQEVVVETLVKQ